MEFDHTIYVNKLIAAVRNHSEIYDKEHDLYFSKPDREETWRKIAKLVGHSAEDCQRRWKLYCERYTEELKKKESLAEGDVFKSKWHCFEQMKFLEEHIAPRKRKRKRQPEPHTIDHSLNDSYKSQGSDRSSFSDACNNSNNHSNSETNTTENMPLLPLPTSTNLSSMTVATSTLEEEQYEVLDNSIEEQDEQVVCAFDCQLLQVDESSCSQEALEEQLSVSCKSNAAVNTAKAGDIIFGKLVTSMLKDIPLEECKDDVKLEIMQLLAKAKRKRLY